MGDAIAFMFGKRPEVHRNTPQDEIWQDDDTSDTCHSDGYYIDLPRRPRGPRIPPKTPPTSLTWVARMTLYTSCNLFHSKELSPLLSLCRNVSRGSIISVYWSLRRLTHLGSNRPGLKTTRHCDMQRRNWRMNSSGYNLVFCPS